jgi:hypothetical protein
VKLRRRIHVANDASCLGILVFATRGSSGNRKPLGAGPDKPGRSRPTAKPGGKTQCSTAKLPQHQGVSKLTEPAFVSTTRSFHNQRARVCRARERKGVKQSVQNVSASRQDSRVFPLLPAAAASTFSCSCCTSRRTSSWGSRSSHLASCARTVFIPDEIVFGTKEALRLFVNKHGAFLAAVSGPALPQKWPCRRQAIAGWRERSRALYGARNGLSGLFWTRF